MNQGGVTQGDYVCCDPEVVGQCKVQVRGSAAVVGGLMVVMALVGSPLAVFHVPEACPRCPCSLGASYVFPIV